MRRLTSLEATLRDLLRMLFDMEIPINPQWKLLTFGSQIRHSSPNYSKYLSQGTRMRFGPLDSLTQGCYELQNSSTMRIFIVILILIEKNAIFNCFFFVSSARYH